MLLRFGDCPDRTCCGIGRGHAGSGWKTGTLGLREAKGLSGGLLPSSWCSLSYKIRSIPRTNRRQSKRTTRLIGIVSALSASTTGSVAIIAEPTTEGGSTGVRTPELLKEEFSGRQSTTGILPYLGLDSESLELGGPSNSSMSKSTTSLSFPFPLSFFS